MSRLRHLAAGYAVVAFLAAFHWVSWTNDYDTAKRFSHAPTQHEQLWNGPTWDPAPVSSPANG